MFEPFKPIITSEKTHTEIQREKILRVLLDADWERVPSYIFSMKLWILQYNSRIFQLRRKYWFNIENKVVGNWDKRKGYFRLIIWS